MFFLHICDSFGIDYFEADIMKLNENMLLLASSMAEIGYFQMPLHFYDCLLNDGETRKRTGEKEKKRKKSTRLQHKPKSSEAIELSCISIPMTHKRKKLSQFL